MPDLRSPLTLRQAQDDRVVTTAHAEALEAWPFTSSLRQALRYAPVTGVIESLDE